MTNFAFICCQCLAYGQVFQSATPFANSSTAPAYGMSASFDALSKDFGNVPHGAKQVQIFTYTNRTNKTVTFVGGRSSCHCATVRALKDSAAPGEKIPIEVVYDARKFTGFRSMTISVDLQGETFETVNIGIRGFSRQDVILEPGQVDLGVVKIGAEHKQTLRLEYAGALDWRLGEVVAGQWTKASLKEVSRASGLVKYVVDVTVDKNAPRGVLHDAVQIKTNDPSSPVVRIEVAGVVDGGLQAAPEAVKFGDVAVGKKVTQKLMVKGDKPFQIVRARHDIPGLSIQSTQGERNTHLVQLEWTPTQKGAVELPLKLVAGPGNEEVTVKVRGAAQ